MLTPSVPNAGPAAVTRLGDSFERSPRTGNGAEVPPCTEWGSVGDAGHENGTRPK
jgi:hypothetical protein